MIKIKHQQGMLLIASMLIMSVFIAVGAMLLKLTISEQKLSSNTLEYLKQKQITKQIISYASSQLDADNETDETSNNRMTLKVGSGTSSTTCANYATIKKPARQKSKISTSQTTTSAATTTGISIGSSEFIKSKFKKSRDYGGFYKVETIDDRPLTILSSSTSKPNDTLVYKLRFTTSICNKPDSINSTNCQDKKSVTAKSSVVIRKKRKCPAGSYVYDQQIPDYDNLICVFTSSGSCPA